ncbi:hypothetical protein HRW13_04895 [Streptomyces lunaelactis]|uniref:hypothetical protein n=1 Tax=Streptomyces lunaelactis TaxID=1535768 RepID=UPI001584B1A7|nr:hypothetical protein [Streptomyces lunaelactis]NUK40243.1 hypothetical protein [Streptomyces lunaelactis]
MSGPLRLVPGEGDTLPVIPRPRPRTRARPSWAEDPIDELAERLVEQVAVAVHPYEVAALLESDGLTGDQITERYARPDLFTLAEDLYARVPRHYPEPPPAPDPWRPDHLRCALRGLVFALPGLAYVLGAGLWHGTADVSGLIASALAAWAWNQALSHRAYLRLAAGGRAAAGRTLRIGGPLGALGAAATGLLVSGPGTGAAFAAGQSCYLAAASVLLVLGRERALLLTLLPVAAGAGATFLWRLPAALALGLLLATVLLAGAAAGHATRDALRSAPTAAGATPKLLRSLPYGLFGLAAGVLAALAGADDPRSVVVLTLSMGFAEWLLYRFRSLAVAGLRESTTSRGFTLRAGRALALCLGAYLALLALGALVAGTGPAPLLGLGAVLWTALLLQAFSVAWMPAAVCLAAAAAEAVAASAGLPPGPTQLIFRIAAAAVLVAGACRLLGRPTAHR